MFQCIGINNAGSVQASAFLEVIPIGKIYSSQKLFSRYHFVCLEFNLHFAFIFLSCFSTPAFSFRMLCYHNFIIFVALCALARRTFCNPRQTKGSKRQKHKKVTTVATTSPPTKKPTKPDLKNMVKAQKSGNARNDEDQKNFSKLALDSLLSKNKNSQFAPGKFPDSSDYLERLNDNQPQSESDDYYDDEDEDEGSIHPISSGTDPNVLLHALTNSQKHQTFADEVSHFSNSHINPVTRKNPSSVEDSKHLSVPLPGPPKAVQAVIVKPRFVTLNWLEPLENPDEVVSYTVYYKMNAADARYEWLLFKFNASTE